MAEDAILGFLQTDDEITDSHEFAAGIGVDHTYLVNVIKRLNGFEIVEAKVLPFGSLSVYLLRIIISLGEEGKVYAVEGSPEVDFFVAVPLEGISLSNLLRQNWIPKG